MDTPVTEERKAKIIFNKPGGNASKGALTYKLALPTAWINAMGITQDSREVTMRFDGGRITIEKV
ncbi:MAG: hypothetical protein DBY32_04035 [Phascolarctobacterium sp.]|nr:MAG: hypothetical protein DBY32_04035 [Phascolarctobacterium sp.]